MLKNAGIIQLFFNSSGRRNGVQFVACNASSSRNGKGAFLFFSFISISELNFRYDSVSFRCF